MTGKVTGTASRSRIICICDGNVPKPLLNRMWMPKQHLNGQTSHKWLEWIESSHSQHTNGDWLQRLEDCTWWQAKSCSQLAISNYMYSRCTNHSSWCKTSSCRQWSMVVISFDRLSQCLMCPHMMSIMIGQLAPPEASPKASPIASPVASAIASGLVIMPVIDLPTLGHSCPVWDIITAHYLSWFPACNVPCSCRGE